MEPFAAIPMENMQHYDFPQRFEEFARRNQDIQSQQRPICRDWVCLIILIIALGGFFGYGGYIIHIGTQNIVLSQTVTITSVFFNQVVGIVLGMMALSIGFSILLLILLRYCPLACLWTLVGLTLGALAGLLIVLFYYQMTSTGIVVSIILALLIICVICYSDRIKQMSTVLQTITIFLEERKRIFFVTLFVILLAIGFMVFWIISYYYMYSLNILGITTNTDYTVGFVFWIVYAILWTFWFYYAIVYIIGAETALWFYNSQKTSVITPIKWLLQGNLGTVTFGAMLLAFIKAVDMILSISLKGRKNRQNSIGNAIFRCCVCLLQCCLRGVYVYMKILNNYNMIICSLTGQSYLVGLKLSGYIILRNFQMFELVKLTSYFVYIGGVVVSSGIPTFIGIYLLQQKVLLYPYAIEIAGAIIFFLSLIIGIVIYSTLMEAVSAMFVIYTLQRCKNQIGVRIDRVLPNQNRLNQYYRNNFSFENPVHPPPHISQTNLNGDNQPYNYNNQMYPKPFQQNQRLSQQIQMQQNPNRNINGGYPF